VVEPNLMNLHFLLNVCLVNGDHFKRLGLMNLIGYSIVSPRMLLIAYIAIFSLIRERLEILGVLSLHIKVIRIGRMLRILFISTVLPRLIWRLD